MIRPFSTLMLATALAGCGGSAPVSPPTPGPAKAAKAAKAAPPADGDVAAKGDGRPAVIFAILDTVRSENTSLCGYERPTTPYLVNLRDRTQVSYTCDAYAAATWTIPTHASYFTGTQVPEHESDSMGIVFADDLPVLSEIMNKRGYQTVLLSANPTLSKTSGLQRGFKHVEVARTLTSMRADDVRKELRDITHKLKDDRPLFLVVNIIDAHDPYPRIPPDVGWAPPRPELPFDVHAEGQNTAYHKFVRGELDAERAKAYTEAIIDGYDYGIYQADQALEGVMQHLRREGWLKHGFRIAVTSDHGEFMGEHQLLRHGCYTWEEVTRVPFIYYDTRRKEQLELPSPFSATNVFWLMKDGKLPDEPVMPQAYSKHREKDVKKGADMAALWTGDNEKIFWMKDEFYRVDLGKDPGENNREVLAADHPHREKLEKMAKDHAEHLKRIRSKTVDADRVSELEALGYVE